MDECNGYNGPRIWTAQAGQQVVLRPCLLVHQICAFINLDNHNARDTLNCHRKKRYFMLFHMFSPKFMSLRWLWSSFLESQCIPLDVVALAFGSRSSRTLMSPTPRYMTAMYYSKGYSSAMIGGRISPLTPCKSGNYNMCHAICGLYIYHGQENT